jgi:hypothetical protein
MIGRGMKSVFRNGVRSHGIAWLIPASLLVYAVAAVETAGNRSTKSDVDFARDVLPILARRCALCHSEERAEGGFSVATRAAVLNGGDSGSAVVEGHSERSLLVELVSGMDDDRIMPAKGPRLSEQQVEILRSWIDRGVAWDEGVKITAASGLARIEPRRPDLPSSVPSQSDHPIDRLLTPYFEKHGVAVDGLVSDRVYARRVYRDLIGLLPSEEQIASLEQDTRSDKRALLVKQLLADRTNYALHWLTFWNDALRNAYRGTGFIDRNRTQITGWLFTALYDNLPYNQFVQELIAPKNDSKGFVQGIVWRGVVNASQRRELQAAQSVSQVFLGINLKCASCHDSFVDPWKLSDAYALAAVFSDNDLEIHECEKTTGKEASPSFLFPDLGSINADASLEDRQQQLAALVTSPKNGRFSRTIVNRLWERLFGRGIIANVDNVDEDPFDANLLDWLATDFADQGYDLQHTMYLICTSRAYQMPACAKTSATVPNDVFCGPLVRRMSAEQFVDAVSQLTGQWQIETKEMTKIDFRGQGGQLKTIRDLLHKRGRSEPLLRASLVDADALLSGMGRPNREQVVTRRETISTPLEALEFTNGRILDRMLREGAKCWLSRSLSPTELVDALYLRALGRKPCSEESAVAVQLVGKPPTPDGIQDFLWTITMLPEFQFIE